MALIRRNFSTGATVSGTPVGKELVYAEERVAYYQITTTIASTSDNNFPRYKYKKIITMNIGTGIGNIEFRNGFGFPSTNAAIAIPIAGPGPGPNPSPIPQN